MLELPHHAVKFKGPRRPPDDFELAYKGSQWSILPRAFCEWQQLYEANVKPLGAVTSRKLLGVDGAKAPPNLPIGIYRSETFATKYSDIPGCGAENVTAKATQNNSWTVYSYLIASSDMPCPTGM